MDQTGPRIKTQGIVCAAYPSTLSSSLVFCALTLLAVLVKGQDLVAPPLQLPVAPPELSSMPHLYVREFRFEGNRVFTAQQLAKVTAPYVGREISGQGLEDARRAVTEYYVSRGYINSGAVLPDQDPRDGVVTMLITEGVISATYVSGNNWLCDDYIRDRVERWAGVPLNINDLKQGLQLLRQDPNITQINAELRPGIVPGESVLDVHVRDEQPFRLALQVDNDRPPSVGSEEVLLIARDINLTGHADPLEFYYGIAEGGDTGYKFSDFNNVSGSYRIPLTRYDTTLRIYGNKNDYAVIEEPFNPLNITSDSYRTGATIRQPIYQTANQELALAITFEHEYAKTFLLGVPFDISPGSTNGVTELSALRISQEWIDRNRDQVLALRSTFSVGLNAADVADTHANRSTEFFAWLGQAQYVRRLFGTLNQFILRTDVQLTDQPLFSLEQFTLGGADSVRGYRENQIVADEGVFSSAEIRLPLFLDRTGSPVVQVAPFFDFGAARNVSDHTPDPTSIFSAGIGLLISPNQHLNAQLYWGYRLHRVATPNNDPQDLGIYFKVSYEAF